MNLIWELGHMDYYTGLPDSFIGKVLACTLATTADALYITLLYLAGRIIVGQRNWTSCLNARRAAAVFGAGVITAVLVELLALKYGFWGYTALMPTLPVFPAGLWPTLQLPLISLAVFAIVGRIGLLENRPDLSY
jgi:hypothetical protein